METRTASTCQAGRSLRRCHPTSNGAGGDVSSMWPYIERCRPGRFVDVTRHRTVLTGSFRRCGPTSNGPGRVVSSMWPDIERCRPGRFVDVARHRRRCGPTSNGAGRVVSSMWPYIEWCRPGRFVDVGLHRTVQRGPFRSSRREHAGSVRRAAKPRIRRRRRLDVGRTLSPTGACAIVRNAADAPRG
jgi:hypothetical protein